MSVDFARPDVLLWLGLLVPAAALLYVLTGRWQAAARAQFADPSVLAASVAAQGQRRGRIKAGLLLGGVMLVVLAVARPHLGLEEPVETRVGSDIVVALDVSLSMAANDVQPTRLERAKQELGAFLDRVEGDRVGLVVFAGAASVRFPLTTDLEAARNLISSIEPDSAPRPGSSLASAVKTAIEMTDTAAKTGEPRSRVLVLVSDGEDLGGEMAEATALVAQHQMPAYTIGVGTPRGSTIPVKGRDGAMVEKTDTRGQVVRTHLDEGTLRSLAQATGGRYYPATPGMSELDRLYAEVLRQSQSTEVVEAGITRPQEAFQIFAALAFLFLAVEWLISESRAVRL